MLSELYQWTSGILYHDFLILTGYSDTRFLVSRAEGNWTVTQGETLIFTEDTINPGGHYSTTTGHYTIPINGTYHFDIHLQSALGQVHAVCKLVVDGSWYFKSHTYQSDGSHPSSHAAAIADLNVGQEVWVENDGQTSILPRQYPPTSELFTWFTGYLLFADD